MAYAQRAPLSAPRSRGFGLCPGFSRCPPCNGGGGNRRHDSRYGGGFSAGVVEQARCRVLDRLRLLRRRISPAVGCCTGGSGSRAARRMGGGAGVGGGGGGGLAPAW